MKKKAGFEYKGMKFPKTRKRGKGSRKAGNSKSSNTKKKALEKINKATVKLKRKQEPCPICLEKIAKKDRVETTCGHSFHKKCLQGWCIQKVKEDEDCFCPVCKTDLKLQTREAKNKIAEKNRLKNIPIVLSPAARERLRLARAELDREYEQSRNNRQIERERDREQRILRARQRRTLRLQAEANQ